MGHDCSGALAKRHILEVVHWRSKRHGTNILGRPPCFHLLSEKSLRIDRKRGGHAEFHGFSQQWDFAVSILDNSRQFMDAARLPIPHWNSRLRNERAPSSKVGLRNGLCFLPSERVDAKLVLGFERHRSYL